MRLDFSDQTQIFNPDTWSWPVHLIGAGGINNLVGPFLAKSGIREIHVWDDDILETRNCPTEIAYSYQSLGQPKVSAMAEAIYRLTEPEYRPTFSHPLYERTGPVKVWQHQERVHPGTTELSGGVVVCGVDSMLSRRDIWDCVKAHFWDFPLFIDGRSGGENTLLFTFSPANVEDVEAYESWLYDDQEVAQLECGARNIGYISGYMATEITRIITRFHRGLPIEFYTPRDHSI